MEAYNPHLIEDKLAEFFSALNVPANAADPKEWNEETISRLAKITTAAAPEYIQATICALMRSLRDGAQKLKQAEIEAITDPLTGLYNRKYCMAKLEEMLFQLMRYPEESAAIAFIDLNKFKPINDTYGHEAGDLALKAVAEALKQNTRRHESVVRLGGDEFCILFAPCAESDHERFDMDTAGKRLRDLFENLTIDYNGQVIAIGASIGVAEIDPDISADENIRLADIAMYQAKAAKGQAR